MGAGSFVGLACLLAALTPASAVATSAPILPFEPTGRLGVLDTSASSAAHEIVFDTSSGTYTLNGLRSDVDDRRQVTLAASASASSASSTRPVWAFDFDALRLGRSTSVTVQGTNPLILLSKRDTVLATPLVLDGAPGADGGRGAGGGGGGGGGAVAILSGGTLRVSSLISVNGGPGGVGNAAWSPIPGGDGGAGAVTLASAREVVFDGTLRAFTGGRVSDRPGSVLIAGPVTFGYDASFNGLPVVRAEHIATESFAVYGGSGGGGGGGTGLPEIPTGDYVTTESPGGVPGAGGGLGGAGSYAVAGGKGGTGGAGPGGGGGGGGGGAYLGPPGANGAPASPIVALPGGPGHCPAIAFGGTGGAGLLAGGGGGGGGNAPGGAGGPGANGAPGGGGGGGGGGGDGCKNGPPPGPGGAGGAGGVGGTPGGKGQPGQVLDAGAGTDVGAIAFVGSATVTPGLSAPLPGAGRVGTWSLSNAGGLPNLGIGVATNGAVGAAVISASGDLHGGDINPFGGAVCGASGGSDGVGSVAIGGSPPVGLLGVGWVQSAATIIVFTGTTQTGNGYGNLAGVVSAIPPIPGVIGSGSCAAGTATQFTIVGAGIATFE